MEVFESKVRLVTIVNINFNKDKTFQEVFFKGLGELSDALCYFGMAGWHQWEPRDD